MPWYPISSAAWTTSRSVAGSPPISTIGRATPSFIYCSFRYRLFVQPEVFEAPAIVLAVDHDRQPFHLRLPAGRCAEVVNDRTRAVLLQFLVDLPDEFAALLRIGLHRLQRELLFELVVAVTGVVALRATAIILVELLVRIVDAAAGVILADLIVLARHFGQAIGGVDL